MTEDARLRRFIMNQLDDNQTNVITTEMICGLVDLTLLNHEATKADLTALSDKANRLKVAAICVYPDKLKDLNINTGIKKATVINFPEGTRSFNQCLFELDGAIGHHAHEIDVVFPYQQWLDGQKEQSLAFIKELITLIHQKNLTSKIIVESGVFDDLEQLHELCLAILAYEPHFLKTSTGFAKTGATLEAGFVMLAAIAKSQAKTGIKFSGGIKSFIDARTYIQLAQQIMQKDVHQDWFRLGASSLLDAL